MFPLAVSFAQHPFFVYSPSSFVLFWVSTAVRNELVSTVPGLITRAEESQGDSRLRCGLNWALVSSQLPGKPVPEGV